MKTVLTILLAIILLLVVLVIWGITSLYVILQEERNIDNDNSNTD